MIRPLLGITLAVALAPAAHAQYRIIRHPDVVVSDEEQQEKTTVDVTWSDYDTMKNPDRPDLGHVDLVPERLVYELITALDTQSYENAIETAKTLVAIAPDRPAAHYNFACVLAVAGKMTDALNELEKAIDCGWRNDAHMSIDATLDNIRATSRYKTLLGKIERLKSEEAITVSPLRTDETSEIIAELEKQIPELLSRYHVPGATVALVRDSKTVWTAAFGRQDTRSDLPMDISTLFKLEPPSRLLTAIVAMQHQEDGLWDLDDSLGSWLPNATILREEGASAVTIRQTLNFTAGFLSETQSSVAESVDAEINQTLRIDTGRTGLKYTFTPGSYLAIGRAIELAMEPRETTDPAHAEKFDNYFGSRVRSGVLLPLGLRETFPLRPETRQVATGHTEYGTPYRDPRQPVKPAAPVYTTAGDLARLVEFMLGRLEGKDRAPLGREAIAELCRTGLNGDEGWGLGVRVVESNVGRSVEISGVGRGSGCLARWYPDSGCGVVILFNSDDGLDPARRIAHLALGGI